MEMTARGVLLPLLLALPCCGTPRSVEQTAAPPPARRPDLGAPLGKRTVPASRPAALLDPAGITIRTRKIHDGDCDGSGGDSPARLEVEPNRVRLRWYYVDMGCPFRSRISVAPGRIRVVAEDENDPMECLMCGAQEATLSTEIEGLPAGSYLVTVSGASPLAFRRKVSVPGTGPDRSARWPVRRSSRRWTR